MVTPEQGHDGLDQRIGVLFPRVDLPDQPGRDEIGKANRPEYELGICKLCFVRQLGRI